MAYWSEFILNHPVVSNSTIWLQAGYDVYMAVGSEGPQGRTNGGLGPASGQGNPPPTPDAVSPRGQGPPNIDDGTLRDVGNPTGTLLYKGTVYSLYVLQ